MTTAYITHEDCQRHDMGPEHPESPLRLQAIRERITHDGLAQELDWVEAQEAPRDAILRVHPETYLHQLDIIVPEKGRVFADPDTAIMADTLKAARLAAGSAIQAVDMVLSRQVQNAFCAVRPPGHHAERGKTMGFCFYNNIAIAAAHALSFHNLERVAIVDFDVHQGNGTIDIFQGDPRVLVCSSFQHPFYPNSHFHGLPSNIVNTPLDAYTKGDAFRRRVEKDWLYRLQDFKPQLILISAGFDAHKADPMANLELVEADYRWVTEMIADVAHQSCGGRIVSMLEGGYNLKALAASAEAHIGTLAEAPE
ncbi:histone deacetylase family protein [Marinobacteraceae bacterium S3BR75-40.1]